LLTSALNIHLNIGQNQTINTSSVLMSLETISFESLSNKLIQQIGNAQISLPSNINSNINNEQTVSLRVCFLVLLLLHFHRCYFVVNDATTCIGR
jgi:hypothetical protein